MCIPLLIAFYLFEKKCFYTLVFISYKCGKSSIPIYCCMVVNFSINNAVYAHETYFWVLILAKLRPKIFSLSMLRIIG